MKRLQLFLLLLFACIGATAQTTPWTGSPVITFQTRTFNGAKELRAAQSPSFVFSFMDSLRSRTYTFGNGLTKSGNDIQLGGTLTQPSTVLIGNNNNALIIGVQSAPVGATASTALTINAFGSQIISGGSGPHPGQITISTHFEGDSTARINYKDNTSNQNSGLSIGTTGMLIFDGNFKKGLSHDGTIDRTLWGDNNYVDKRFLDSVAAVSGINPDSVLHPLKNLYDVPNKATARLNLGVSYADTSYKAFFRYPIRAYGDSFTEAFTQTSYISQLQTLTGIVGSNFGIGGQTSTQIKTRLLADSVNKINPTIIEAGRNNFTDSTTVVNDIAAMVSALGHNRYLVFPVIHANVSTEWAGTTKFNQIENLNNYLKSTYGIHYADVQTYTFNQNPRLTTQDNLDYTHGVIAQRFRVDSLHLLTQGYGFWAKYIIESKLSTLFGANGSVVENTLIPNLFNIPPPLGKVSPNKVYSSKGYFGTSIDTYNTPFISKSLTNDSTSNSSIFLNNSGILFQQLGNGNFAINGAANGSQKGIIYNTSAAALSVALKLANQSGSTGTSVALDFNSATSSTSTGRIKNTIESTLQRGLTFSAWTGSALNDVLKLTGNGHAIMANSSGVIAADDNMNYVQVPGPIKGTAFNTVNGAGLTSLNTSSANLNLIRTTTGNDIIAGAPGVTYGKYRIVAGSGNETFNIFTTGHLTLQNSGTFTDNAWLSLPAGAATAAAGPLKFATGVANQTVVEQGTVNWDGTRLYIGSTATPVNQTFAYLSDVTGFTSPMTTLGDVIYGGASGVPTRLAGNTATSRQFLTSTGNGTISAAPAYFNLFGTANTWTGVQTHTFGLVIGGASPINYNYGTFSTNFGALTSTANRTINLPDASGTVALTSDIAKYLRLTGSGTGAATTISIAHGQTGITSASIAVVTPINAAASGISYVTCDATNINIVFQAAPVSGTNNLSFNVFLKP